MEMENMSKSKKHLRRFSDQFNNSSKPKDQIIQQLELLLDITRKLASYDILDNAFITLERIIATSLQAEKAFIYTFRESDNELIRRSQANDEHKFAQVCNSFAQVDACFSSGNSDVYNAPQGEQFTSEQIRNFACAPLHSTKGNKLGVIQVINKKAGEFNEEDLTLINTLGQHLGLTLENAIKNEHATQVHEEELKLLNVVADVATDLDLVSMIHKIISETTHLLRAERATVFLYDEQTDELFSHVGTGLESKEIRLPVTAGIAGQVFRTQETVNIPYAYADLRFNPAIDKATGFFTRSILCVPLINTKGECIGVTQVLNKNGGPFNKEDEARLKAFTTQIAVGIENAKLFNDVQNINNYIESMLQSMSNGVLTFDCDNHIITCNRAAEEILEITEKEIINKEPKSLFGKANQWLSNAIHDVNQSRDVFEAIDAELNINKSHHSVNVHIQPLVSVDGTNLGTVLLIEDISKEKRLKTTMARYMDPSVANQLIEDAESKLGGQSTQATILFSDIRSFTTISEHLGPQGTVSFLNYFFTEMVNCIQDHQGIVNKFIGDALLGVFGVPLDIEDEVDKAVRAALAMTMAVKAMNQRKAKELGGKKIEIGIGINTDNIVFGNIGSPKRMDFTVIGDGVNLASRMESACKFYDSRILISEHTKNKLKGTYRIRELDKVIVKGKQRPISLFEIVDCYSEAEFPNMLDVINHSQECIKYYRRQEWGQAIYHCNQILKLRNNDKMAQMYIERSKMMEQTAPGDDWDGVWTMTSK